MQVKLHTLSGHFLCKLGSCMIDECLKLNILSFAALNSVRISSKILQTINSCLYNNSIRLEHQFNIHFFSMVLLLWWLIGNPNWQIVFWIISTDM